MDHTKTGIYLCRVEGLKFIDYAILRWDGKFWWQYIKDIVPGTEGWIGCGDLKIIEVLQLIEETES